MIRPKLIDYKSDFEILIEFQKFGTGIIRFGGSQFFVNKNGYITPIDYADNNKNQMRVEFAFEEESSRYGSNINLREVEQLSEELYRFKLYQGGKHSDWRWDEHPTGLGHATGHKLIYRIEGIEYDDIRTWKSSFKEYDGCYHLSITYGKRFTNTTFDRTDLVFNKPDLRPLFVIGTLKEGIDNIEAVHNLGLHDKNLFKYEFSWYGRRIWKKYCENKDYTPERSHVHGARYFSRENFNEIDSLLKKILSIQLSQKSILGVPAFTLEDKSIPYAILDILQYLDAKK